MIRKIENPVDQRGPHSIHCAEEIVISGVSRRVSSLYLRQNYTLYLLLIYIKLKLSFYLLSLCMFQARSAPLDVSLLFTDYYKSSCLTARYCIVICLVFELLPLPFQSTVKELILVVD